jgi:hypothetical protein
MQNALSPIAPNAVATLRDADAFWGEIASCEHTLHLHEEGGDCLNTLEEFALGGLRAGAAVVVIATPGHLRGLELRLRQWGIFDAAVLEERYVALDAEAALAEFMVDGWPDEGRFLALINDLLERARGPGRRVRTFGEMVALLWAQGLHEATAQLERLWHRLCQEQKFAVLCAYPKAGFSKDSSAAAREICAEHSYVLAGRGSRRSTTAHDAP